MATSKKKKERERSLSRTVSAHDKNTIKLYYSIQFCYSDLVGKASWRLFVIIISYCSELVRKKLREKKRFPSNKASLILTEVLASIPGELMSVERCKEQLLRAQN